MTDVMDYRQMPTRLQEYLFKRWLKRAKKQAAEFRMHGEECFTTEIHSQLEHFEETEYDSRRSLALAFENGQLIFVCPDGVSPVHMDWCRAKCQCPIVLYSYRIEGSPEWHDYEDWLAQVGLDFRDEDEDLPDELAA